MTYPLLADNSAVWSHPEIPTDVEIPIYDNTDMLDNPNDGLPILILGGYGENHRITSQTIRKLGEQQIAAVGAILPYNELPADRRIIEAASIEMPHAIGDMLKERANLPPESPIKTINHSQGGGAWALARRHRSEGFGDTVLWGPVGFNTPETHRAAENRRIADFVGRFILNALKQNPLDPAVLPAGLEVSGQAVYDIRTGRFVPKVGLAVMLALQREAIGHVNQGHRVGILTGKRDGIFKDEEIAGALQANAVRGDLLPDILEAPGSHPNMNTRAGMKQLRVATGYLNRNNSQPK